MTWALRSPVETLVNGAVLAVDGQKADLCVPDLPHHQLPRHHQRLLVGQSHVPAGPDSGQGGNQTRRTGNGRHDHSRLHFGGQFRDSLLPLPHRRPRKSLAEPRRPLTIMKGDGERRVFLGLFQEPGGIFSRRQAHDPELIRVQVDQTQRAASNGTRRAQNRNFLHLIRDSSGDRSSAAVNSPGRKSMRAVRREEPHPIAVSAHHPSRKERQ